MKILTGLYIAAMIALAAYGANFNFTFGVEDHETTSPVSCVDHNFDVKKIAAALRQRVSKESLFLHLGRGTGLEIARIESIRALIEDAYKNPHAIQRWTDNHLWVCT